MVLVIIQIVGVDLAQLFEVSTVYSGECIVLKTKQEATMMSMAGKI